jgi:prepilin-type N-terminal cleavage/methylation domain-containing protein
MTKVHGHRTSEAGYSLTEMMVALGIIGVLSGMAVTTISGTRPGALGDGAMRLVLSQMNTARELAITQRRNMRVTFTLSNKVEILREEVPPAAAGTTTTISSVLMEGGLQFLPVANLVDTPDAFCSSLSAVCLPTATGTPPEVKFKPDGTFVNQDGTVINGTVFVSLPNQIYVVGHSTGGVLSGRAVTIQGSTGRVRGYRFDGSLLNLPANSYWKPV